MEDLLARNGLRLKIKLSTNYLETIKALISAGYATEGAIALTCNLDCVYHRQRQMSRAARAFFDLLCQHAGG